MINENQPADPRVQLAATQAAYRCRWRIQAVLREEEWGLAQREFYMIIREEIEQVFGKK
jgi:hypothetical protein